MTEEPVSRGDIFLVALNPTRGPKIRKIRPYFAVSPDELNSHLRTFIIAPLTMGGHPYPFRVRCRFDSKDGHVVADQLRAVDRDRLVKRLGSLSDPTLNEMLSVCRPCLLCGDLANTAIHLTHHRKFTTPWECFSTRH